MERRIHTIVRDGDRWLIGHEPSEVVIAHGENSFAALDAMSRRGFWVGFCSYDLGRSIEHVDAIATDELRLPDLAFARFDTLTPLDALPDFEPSEPVGASRSNMSRAEHATRIEAIQELLRSGECYQVNLTRQVAMDAPRDPLAMFGALMRANPAPYALYCDVGNVTVLSASPELFLRVDGRVVETRPIKGTATDANSLCRSAKDRAENVMIVDLARNDLGRVCEYGSITVPALTRVEPHPGLHHLVSTVHGTLRPNVGLGDLVRATFPPASVTGAPKPRVLRAIEALEPVRRGVYCGAVGWIDGDHGRAQLAVAIRTFVIARAAMTLGVGGGIVADSKADAEWAETELKAARLLHAVGALESEPVAIP